MKVSKNGLNFISKEEGCRLTAYKLPGECSPYWTIGVGHCSAEVYQGMQISHAKAIELLATDLKTCENAVNSMRVPFQLSQNMFDALVSYAFNRGTNKLKDLAGNETPEQMAQAIVNHWGSAQRYKTQLIERRKREAALFLDGYIANNKHIQLNYHQNQNYTLATTLNVRNKPSTAGTKIGSATSGKIVKNLATTRTGNEIWMYIGLDNRGREQWICADTGSKAYIR